MNSKDNIQNKLYNMQELRPRLKKNIIKDDYKNIQYIDNPSMPLEIL